VRPVKRQLDAFCEGHFRLKLLILLVEPSGIEPLTS
jgi:hypothetical protein